MYYTLYLFHKQLITYYDATETTIVNGHSSFERSHLSNGCFLDPLVIVISFHCELIYV